MASSSENDPFPADGTLNLQLSLMSQSDSVVHVE
jgi:hypothetical protein